MFNIVKTEKIKYRYPQATHHALDEITLSIKKGEFVAVLGHNGSGKSTLAKLLNALYLPTEGVIWIDNMVTTNEEKLWQIRKTAGMVFQNPDNQIIATIAEEDVAFGPENLGVPRQEIVERVNFAIERVDMIPFKDRPPHLLSGGQKQRISIAGVLAMKPSVIIFDEPTAMLDPVGRKEVIDTILNLHREGITVILITHDMQEAFLADRIIVIDKGKIVKNDIPEVVFGDVEGMQELSLDVPDVIKITYLLKKQGINLPTGILTRQQLVDAICQYNSKM